MKHVVRYKDFYCVYRIDIGRYYYYGSTKNIYLREQSHRNALISNRHHNSFMQRAYNKYETFTITVVYASMNKLDYTAFEQKYLNAMFSNKPKECMNIAQDVVSPNKDRKLSQETKDKISKSHLGLTHSEETREKIRIARVGTKLSDNTKKKCSESQKKRFAKYGHPRTGKAPSNTRSVVVSLPNENDVTFESLKLAAEFIQVPSNTLHNWISGVSKFPGQGRKVVDRHKHLTGLHAYYADEEDKWQTSILT